MNLSKIYNISLKWKLLIPFLFLSFVGTTSLILLSLNNQRRLIETQEKKKLTDYYRAFLDHIEDRERSALSLAYQVARSPEVQEPFAQGDRQALVDLLLPSYQILKEKFDVKQFHFHVKPATSFLRLHRIYQFGETMESFRQTINKVVETGDGIAGLEWGVTGFGVRSVAPVYYRDAMIGTFEIGYSVERPFLEALKRRYDMDHFFSPFVAEELEKADLEVPLTKVVIHRHGGIISINQDEDDQIGITISFSLSATAPGASIDSA